MLEPRTNHPGHCNEYCRAHGCAKLYAEQAIPHPDGVGGGVVVGGWTNALRNEYVGPVTNITNTAHPTWDRETDTLPPPEPYTYDYVGHEVHIPIRVQHGYEDLSPADLDEFHYDPRTACWLHPVRDLTISAQAMDQLRRQLREAPEMQGLRNIVTEDVRQRYNRILERYGVTHDDT